MEHLSDFSFDYGVRPRLMLVGDVEFPSLIARSLSAVGYGSAPSHGAMTDVPVLSLFLQSASDARDLFGRFRAWSPDGPYVRGVRISFVESDDDSFGLCVVQDESSLMRRMLSRELESEVEAAVLGVGHVKRFPRISEHYRAFKETCRGRAVLIAAVTPSGVLEDCMVLVESLTYYEQSNMPANCIERTLVMGDSEDGVLASRHADPDLTPTEIARRRNRQLRRFFPVTLERLRCADAMKRLVERLSAEGYSSWQIKQSFCNVTLRSRFPNLFHSKSNDGDGKRDGVSELDVLRCLLGGHEDPQFSLTESHSVDVDSVRRQIVLDSRYVLGQLCREVPVDISDNLQLALAEYGLLAEST